MDPVSGITRFFENQYPGPGPGTYPVSNFSKPVSARIRFWSGYNRSGFTPLAGRLKKMNGQRIKGRCRHSVNRGEKREAVACMA